MIQRDMGDGTYASYDEPAWAIAPLVNDGREWGVWSEEAGGFVAAQLTRSTVGGEIDGLVEEGHDRDDLQALAVCPEHEEQPADDCEEC